MKTVVTLGIGVSLLVGCGGPDFDEQRDQWREQRPEEYAIRISGTGFSNGVGWALGVSGSTVVVSATTFGDGEWTFNEQPEQRDPVEALFDRAERASDDCDLSVSFNAEYGYVSKYYQDCENESSGETVTCFVPGTSDLTQCKP